MILDYHIDMIHDRFTQEPCDVWIRARSGRGELAIIGVEPWQHGAVCVGTFTSTISKSDFADAVREAEREFLGMAAHQTKRVA